MRLYIDSNVLIGYFKDELGGLTQAHMIRVKEFLEQCESGGHIVILSDLVFDEIEKHAYHNEREVLDFLDSFDLKSIVIYGSDEDYQKAKEIGKSTGIHFPDNLHVQLALRSKADAVVTWNIKDFEKVKGIIDVFRPSELFKTFSL